VKSCTPASSFLTHSREVPAFFASGSRPSTRSDRTRPPSLVSWILAGVAPDLPLGMVPAILRRSLAQEEGPKGSLLSQRPRTQECPLSGRWTFFTGAPQDLQVVDDLLRQFVHMYAVRVHHFCYGPQVLLGEQWPLCRSYHPVAFGLPIRRYHQPS